MQAVALHRRTPTEAYNARPKATASGIPFLVAHYRVRHDKIDSNGKVTLLHNSRLHHIGLGRRHAGETILLLVHDLHVRIITTSGTLLRDFQLDPDRDYQPRTKSERCLETPVNGVSRHRSGGAEGIRTPDPLDANEVRYRTAPQPRVLHGGARGYQPLTARLRSRISSSSGPSSRISRPASSPSRVAVHWPGLVRSRTRGSRLGATDLPT